MLQAYRQESGPYDNGASYFLGDIVETDTGADTVFWIANGTIPAGRGAPSFLNPRDWFVLATAGSWRGEVDITDTYELHEGDVYHIGDEVYIVTEDIGNVTGAGLREGDHIEEISNPHFQNEGTELVDAETVRTINSVGAGVDCSLDALGIAEINVQADILSIATSTTSGLAGGDTDGDVSLSLDVKNLPIYDTPISHLDHLPITDESVAGDPTRTPHAHAVRDMGRGTAERRDRSGRWKFHIQTNELLLSTTPANADRLVGWDQSAFVPRAFELDTLRSYFRTVAANPSGSPSDSLTTIFIDGTIYSIEGRRHRNGCRLRAYDSRHAYADGEHCQHRRACRDARSCAGSRDAVDGVLGDDLRNRRGDRHVVWKRLFRR